MKLRRTVPWRLGQRRGRIEPLEPRQLLASHTDAGVDEPVSHATTVPAFPLDSSAAWPWLLTLSTSSGIRCTGSLIAPNAILTAAHCVPVGSADQVFATVDNSA